MHGDIANAFYNMEIPDDLSDLFSLPSVPYGLLRQHGLGNVMNDGHSINYHDLLVPCLKVLPMGWSWSLHLCQAVLCNAIRRAGFSDNQLIF